MKVTEKDVKRLALMSRLELTAEDITVYAKSLNASLDYMDRLKKLNTDSIEPAGHVFPLKNVFREDRVQVSMDKQLALANAPEQEKGSFKVPRIV